jgi:hypothetical protein
MTCGMAMIGIAAEVIGAGATIATHTQVTTSTGDEAVTNKCGVPKGTLILRFTSLLHGGTRSGGLIGAIAGGGRGAAIGAGAGAGAGTAVQVMTKGEQVHVPSETLLEFVLQQEVRIPVAYNSAEMR